MITCMYLLYNFERTNILQDNFNNFKKNLPTKFLSISIISLFVELILAKIMAIIVIIYSNQYKITFIRLFASAAKLIISIFAVIINNKLLDLAVNEVLSIQILYTLLMTNYILLIFISLIFYFNILKFIENGIKTHINSISFV